MTEEDYVRVRDLARIDIALHLLDELIPGENVPDDELKSVLRKLTVWYAKIRHENLHVEES